MHMSIYMYLWFRSCISVTPIFSFFLDGSIGGYLTAGGTQKYNTTVSYACMSLSKSHNSKLIAWSWDVCTCFSERREKEERSKQGQTNKAKQHSTPKAVTPQVGLEPTTLHDTLYSRQSALPLSYTCIRIG